MEEKVPQNEIPPSATVAQRAQETALVPAELAAASLELDVVHYRRLPGKASEVLAMAKEAAARWLPVVKENGKVVGQKALEASKWTLQQIGTAAAATQEKGKALAEEWTPVVKAKGAELAAQARDKSKKLLQTLAKQSAEMSAQAGKQVALWWNGPPLENDLLECLRNAGEAEYVAEVHLELQKLEADTLDVVLFGEFSVGKSSLLNAFVGRSLLHEDVVPSTGQITRLVQAAEHQVKVRLADGTQVEIDVADLKEFTTLDEQGLARADIVEVVIGIDCPLLQKGVTLADAPGSFDPGSGKGKVEQIERTLNAFRHSDVVIWVCHAARLLRDSELALTEQLVKRHPYVQLIPVINFMGELAEKDRANVRARASRILSERFSENLMLLIQHDPAMPPYFEVDARQAQDCPEETTDGFAGLTRLLASLGTNEAIRNATYKARIKRLQSLLALIQEKVQPAIQRCHSQAAIQVAQHGERVREAELWVRRFETEAEVRRVSLDEEIESLSSSNLSRLIQIELVGHSLKELPKIGENFGLSYLKEVFDDAAEAANNLIYALAGKHGLPGPERIKRGWFAVSFSLDVKETSFWERTLGGRSFRESYMEHFNRQFRHAWNESIAPLKQSLRNSWEHSVRTLLSYGWHRQVSAFLDGSATNSELITIKAREQRLRAGAQFSFIERGTSRHAEAQKLLSTRTARGERLSAADLYLECLDAALSAVQNSLPLRKKQKGPSDPRKGAPDPTKDEPNTRNGPPALPKPQTASTLVHDNSHARIASGASLPPPLPIPIKPPPLP